MKTIKRIFLVILIFGIAGILLRGLFYRHLISYKSIGQRSTYLATNYKLIDCLENSSDQKKLDIKEIIKLGLLITSKHLRFAATLKDNNDPNNLIASKTANCVGYASFCATTYTYLFKKYNLSSILTAKRQIGQLYFLGFNINSFFTSPFFKDHDFVTIENKVTGEIFAVDPTVNDYLLIDFVTYKI